MKAGASFLIALAMLLGVAQAAAARPVGALAFDSNRCDQGGHPGDSTAPNYSPCQESIFRVNADGTGLTRLTNPTNYSGPEPGADFSPSWSPDGARIVFMHTDMRGNYPGNQGWPVDLTIMNADGSGAHGIFTGSSLVDPAWSPHGDAIAFSQPIWGVGDQLKLVHTDGSHEQALTPQDFLWFQDTQWTPDGRRLTGLGSHWEAVPNGTPMPTTRYTDFGIWSVDRDGSNFRRLTVGDVSLNDAAFSPDGRYLAFSVWDPAADTPKGDVFTLRLDGAERTLRSDVETAFAPIWSPFGPTLFFHGNAPGTGPFQAGIRSVDLGTGGPSLPVTDGKWRDGDMSWSSLGLPLPQIPPDLQPPVAVLGITLGVPGAPATSGARKLGAATSEHQRAGRLPFLAFDRSGIRTIDVAVGRRARGRCRFLGKGGKLGHRQRCASPHFVRFRGDARWRKLTRGLPKGTYEVRFRTMDVKGHRTKHPKVHVVALH